MIATYVRLGHHVFLGLDLHLTEGTTICMGDVFGMLTPRNCKAES